MIALIALAATLPAVFGIQLGAPVALPECARAEIAHGVLSPDLYAQGQAVLCEQRPGVQYHADPHQGGIVFPTAQMPLILGFPTIATIILDGKLEAIRADTLGLSQADAIMDQLKQKFGPPTETADETVYIRKFPWLSVRALWIRDGYRVEYHGIGGNRSYGWVRVETEKARAVREAEEHAAEPQRTPL